MGSLREALTRAQRNRSAVGHLNVADVVLIKAVFEAAHALKLYVVIGAFDKEREFPVTGKSRR